MGIHAQIVPEERSDANRLSDPDGHFAKLLATTPFPETSCLRFIDHYGLTLFNRLQLPVLLAEVASVVKMASTTEPERSHLRKLTDLIAAAIAKGPHAFVGFEGD